MKVDKKFQHSIVIQNFEITQKETPAQLEAANLKVEIPKYRYIYIVWVCYGRFDFRSKLGSLTNWSLSNGGLFGFQLLAPVLGRGNPSRNKWPTIFGVWESNGKFVETRKYLVRSYTYAQRCTHLKSLLVTILLGITCIWFRF